MNRYEDKTVKQKMQSNIDEMYFFLHRMEGYLSKDATADLDAFTALCAYWQQIGMYIRQMDEAVKQGREYIRYGEGWDQ